MKCVYCLENEMLGDRQILLAGENLYICAPLGQVVEGYLAIAPHRCIGSLSKMPLEYFTELEELTTIVSDFYARAYGTTQHTYYEQGRAGGDGPSDEVVGFPLHAHLCSLPRAVELHPLLSRDYARREVSNLREVPEAAKSEPYIYVDSMGEKSVYIAATREGRESLERKRLKPAIASLLGVPDRGYWRTYPGDQELEQLIERWRNLWPV